MVWLVHTCQKASIGLSFHLGISVSLLHIRSRGNSGTVCMYLVHCVGISVDISVVYDCLIMLRRFRGKRGQPLLDYPCLVRSTIEWNY